MKKLYENYQLGEGVSPDLHPKSGGIWEDSWNVHFTQEGVMSPHRLNCTGNNVSDEPLFMFYHQPSSDPSVGVLLWGNGSKLYVQIPETDVTPATWAAAVPAGPANVRMCSFGDWVWIECPNGVFIGKDVITSPTAPVVPTDPPTTFGTTYDRGAVPVVLGPHVIRCILDSEKIEWCDADDPDTWTPASSNQAGDLTLRGLGAIESVKVVGDVLYVFGTRSTAVVRYVGHPFVFGYEIIDTSEGCLKNHGYQGILSHQGAAVYWSSKGGPVMRSGTQVQALADGKIQKYLRGRSAYPLSGSYLPKLGVYQWVLAVDQNTSADDAFIIVEWNPDGNSWSFGNQTPTWYTNRTSAFQTFLYIYSDMYNGQVVYICNLFDGGSGATTKMYTCLWEAKLFQNTSNMTTTVCPTLYALTKPIGPEEDLKWQLQGVRLGMHQFRSTTSTWPSAKMKLTVYVYQELSSDPVPHDFLVDERQEMVYMNLTGRWFAFKFYSEERDTRFCLAGFSLYGVPTGGNK